MRMQEFKEGRIAVYAETKEEALRFLTACEKEGLRWCSGHEATEYRDGVGAPREFAVWDGGITQAGMFCAPAEVRGFHSRRIATKDHPYKSVTVKEFFDGRADDLSFEAFKQGKYAVTFKNPKRGDPEVEAFLRVCEAEGLNTEYMNADANIRPGIKADTFDLYGAHCQTTDLVPYPSVPWLHPPKREHITIYRTKDGRVECAHKVDGKEVGKASVTRYYKDEDNFLTAAKCVVEKLSSPLPPFDENGKPNYKVGDRVRMREGYTYHGTYHGTFIGEITEVDAQSAPTEMHYRVRDPEGDPMWQQDSNVIGLAE